MLKAKSHIPCRAPAVLWPYRSERDISTPSRGTAWAQQAEWINIGRLSTAFGRPAQVRLFPVTTRTFSRVVFQNAATFGMCVIVLMTMDTADYTQYELTLKIKPVFLLLLCYVSIVSAFHCMWATTLSKFFEFRNTHSKTFEKFLPVIFQTPKQSVKFSIFFFCSKHITNPVFSFFTNFPAHERR